jgi:MerR family transcriptional regulator, thiopeptide resistance regulator
MAKKLSPLHQELIPYLYYRDPGAAAEFLAKAFGFTLRGIHRDDAGGVMHAELGVGRSAVMLGPAREEVGFKAPNELPARHAGVWCYVDDADAHCAKSRAAGALIVREPCDQFYGVREYTARDLEGQEWFFATPLASASPAPRRKPVKDARARGSAKPKTRAAKKK